MILKFKKLRLKNIENDRGLYSFAELREYIDFTVKRVYFLQNCKESTGQHSHKLEEEMFILVKGSCTAVIDQGNDKEDVRLGEVGDAIYVGNYVWHGFKDLSADAVLLALSSTNYNPDRSDYIEDYDEYKKIVANS